MQKDFDGWQSIKKRTQVRDASKIYFREREIWWVRLGVNVGYEQDGKGSEYTRPVVVLKKHNQFTALVVPISKTKKRGGYYVPIGIVEGQEAVAVVSQLRVLDVRRFIRPVQFLGDENFLPLIKRTLKQNFGEYMGP